MAYSNSSLNTYLSCQRKYWHNYINHTPPCKPPSPHLEFGSMAHEVLEKAGILYDDLSDNVRELTKEDYISVIPSELVRPDLKDCFGIKSWATYFVPIIKQCREYEQSFVKELSANGSVRVLREQKMQLTNEDLFILGYPYKLTMPIVGVIDLLIFTDTEAVILDYKFSTKRKTQDDFDMNSQLYLYALFVHNQYGIPLHNIRVGYIDIPKQDFGRPTILSNGTLSRAKSQNVLPELYKQAVEIAHGKDPYYNCDEGGYYYETYCALQLNKTAYLSVQYLDIDAYKEIINDCIKTAIQIDKMGTDKDNYMRKYDSYSCSGCEFLTKCKSWLTVKGE